MSMISLASLVAAGLQPTQARIFCDPFARACAQFDINTPVRAGALFGQCYVESKGFTRLEENCYWRDPVRLMSVFSQTVRSAAVAQRLVANPKAMANYCYAHKNGNGDEASGDGWNYRGRGPIQITGKGNYEDAGIECRRPYLEQPELLLRPDDACLSAAWFFYSRKCLPLADDALIDSITRLTNGPAMLERDLRRQMTHQATLAFSA